MISSCELCGVRTGPITDHCHAHGMIRGNVCRSCNAILGRIDAGKPSATDLKPDAIKNYLARCPGCAPPETAHLASARPYKFHPVRVARSVMDDVQHLRRQLANAIGDDLTQSDAIGVSIAYGLANRETLVQWARDQRSKGSDH